jgi:hypothetical protein
LASVSFCAITARAPVIIAASRCGAFPSLPPRAADGLAVQGDDQGRGTGQVREDLVHQVEGDLPGHAERERAGR